MVKTFIFQKKYKVVNRLVMLIRAVSSINLCDDVLWSQSQKPCAVLIIKNKLNIRNTRFDMYLRQNYITNNYFPISFSSTPAH